MIKYIIAVLLFLFLSCSNYTFYYGSTLAEQQTNTLNSYINNDTISQETLDSLENNLWVTIALKTCPCNLTVRNLCLIDLINDNNDNVNIINEQLLTIGPRLWLEGYSYWKFTKPYLIQYARKFGYFAKYIMDMDLMFQLSAYKMDGIVYPAPFGDLAHIALDDQTDKIIDNFEIYPITKSLLIDGVIEYNIEKCVLGFNTHVPDSMTIIVTDATSIFNGSVCVIKDDSCVNFEWYEGYDKKYGDKLEELEDVFRNDRVNWMLARKWWRKYSELIDYINN